jgi:hypothetical protein
MSYVSEEWFVREPIRQELNSKIVDISSYILDTYGDDVLLDDLEAASDAVVEGSMRFMDVQEMTEDELEFMVDQVLHYCVIGYAIRKGILREDKNGNIVLPSGVSEI